MTWLWITLAALAYLVFVRTTFKTYYDSGFTVFGWEDVIGLMILSCLTAPGVGPFMLFIRNPIVWAANKISGGRCIDADDLAKWISKDVSFPLRGRLGSK